MRSRHFLLLAFCLALLALAVAHAGEPGAWLFAQLKSHQVQLAQFADARPLLAGTLYILLLVLATSLSLPLATLLTIAAGAVFAFAEAFLLTVVGGTVGATVAMLLSRYLLRDLVEARWPHWVARINRGVDTSGAFYLLWLRLSPAPPFFVVNAAMGLTRMPARQFLLVTLVGVAPLDAVFVNAGHALGRLDAPGDVLGPQLVLALFLLGAAPLLLRAGLRRWRRGRRADHDTG